jgi:two-component system KDP operon response regulator KdpE
MKRLLVIDDEPAIRALIEASLASEFEISTAADGFGALESLRSVHPDLILLDVGLPGMSGVDVLRRIRANCDLQETPVLILTGVEPPDGLRANGVVMKPFTPASLRAALSQAGV